MSMAEEQRLILKQLFGRDYSRYNNKDNGGDSFSERNNSKTYNNNSFASFGQQRGESEAKNKYYELYNRQICKLFLVGKCPHDLFIGTKADMGRCKRLHLEKYKIFYEGEQRNLEKKIERLQHNVEEKISKKRENIKEPGEKIRDEKEKKGDESKMDIDSSEEKSEEKTKSVMEQLLEEDKMALKMIEDFEYEYIKQLEYHVDKLDRLVALAKENLKPTLEEQNKIDKINSELDGMDIRIGLVEQEITLLNKKGDILRSLRNTEELERLIMQRKLVSEKIEASIENFSQIGQQKLEVCNICGANLSKLDSDRRLADHFIGKIHLGFNEMRKTLKIMKASSRRFENI